MQNRKGTLETDTAPATTTITSQGIAATTTPETDTERQTGRKQNCFKNIHNKKNMPHLLIKEKGWEN